MFDADDVEYLLNRFDLLEIKEMIHNAEIQSAVYRTFGEDNKAYYYFDFISAANLAIDILRSRLPIPPPVQLYNGVKIDIETIKGRNDIVSVAERYTTLKKSGNRYSGRCPLHEEKTPSFIVYPDRQTWHCFGACSRGGDVIDLVMLAEHLDFKAAAEALV
jgi:hypothetical protein